MPATEPVQFIYFVEDVISANLDFVSAPQKNIELKQTLIDETVQVSCIAEGVYPAPNMTLLAGNR